MGLGLSKLFIGYTIFFAFLAYSTADIFVLVYATVFYAIASIIWRFLTG